MSILKQIHIADIHFGAIDPKLQFDILVDQVLNKLERLDFDVFFINGDLFHHKFMTNSDVVMYASMFIENVVNLCNYKHAELVILHGTASHDANQLKIFYHYMGGQVPIYIVEHTSFIEVKGCKILCIPEEYNMGREYYENFLYKSGTYDMAVMHGTLVESIYGKNVEDLDSNREPVFDINSFKFCNGPIICGHVHTPKCYDYHMYYCGSPIRWQFGEEETKGFIICLFDTVTHKYYVHLEEVTSFRYDTITLDSLVSYDPKSIISYINNLQATKGIDYLKVKFIENFDGLPIVKQYYKNKMNVVIDSSNVAFQEIAQQNQQNFQEFEEYKYVLDKNLSPLDIFVRYINQQKQDTYISVDELRKILET